MARRRKSTRRRNVKFIRHALSHTQRRLLKRRHVRKQQARRWISRKIRILRHEGYPQRKAVALAYAMAFKQFGAKIVSLKRTLHRLADSV